jgi:hypothetical protein
LRSRQPQAGIVSIIVATLLIIIVSLIVIAFAQVSRREQRESLDAQLSTQAYYAADTGVNAAREVVAKDVTKIALDSCQGLGNAYNYTLGSAADDVAITCLRIDPNPTDLSYQLDTTSAKVVPILPAGGVGINSLTFSWPKSPGLNQDVNTCDSTLVGGAYSLPSQDTWTCPYALVRVDLVDGAQLDRASLLDNDKVSFLLPVANGGGDGIINDISPTTCALSCSITFKNLNYSSMYLRLISMYQGGENVTIKGTDTAGQPIHFSGAQAKIDATGRAQDVLRRIVVSAPLLNIDNASPIQALVSGDSVCKRFAVFGLYYHDFATDDSTLGCGP